MINNCPWLDARELNLSPCIPVQVLHGALQDLQILRILDFWGAMGRLVK